MTRHCFYTLWYHSRANFFVAKEMPLYQIYSYVTLCPLSEINLFTQLPLNLLMRACAHPCHMCQYPWSSSTAYQNFEEF